MEYIIKEYVNKLSEEDIKNFARAKGININDDEAKILYVYIKNYWLTFYNGNPFELFIELKEKLRPRTYEQVVKLYKEYKKKY